MSKDCNNKRFAIIWNYTVFREESFNEKVGHYITYNIRISNREEEYIKRNVALDEKTAYWIAGYFEGNQVHPCHFYDVAEDLIDYYED